jgi:hypothetical protein
MSKKCPNDCSGNGICNDANGKCICNDLYTGDDCSENKTCPENCNGNGLCNAEKKCECLAPYIGESCNIKDESGSISSVYVILYILMGVCLIAAIIASIILYRS